MKEFFNNLRADERTMIVAMVFAIVIVSVMSLAKTKTETTEACPSDRLVIIENKAYCEINTKK